MLSLSIAYSCLFTANDFMSNYRLKLVIILLIIMQYQLKPKDLIDTALKILDLINEIREG